MNADKFASIAGMLVTVAGVTVIVSHPESARIIKATGQAFTAALRAAMGR